MKPFSRTNTAPGFTNVEIMVVISILAILLSFLLPLLSRSRDMAYKAQCASNLKQLSTAFNLYANDWSGYWPAPGGLRGNKTYWSQSAKGGLNPYVRQVGVKSVWCCPIQDTWNGGFSARTYSMNGYLRTPCDLEYEKGNTILRGISPDKIPLASKTILLYEGALLVKTTNSDLDYIYRCANWSYVRGFSNDSRSIEVSQPWHRKVNNYLYCDGHLVARKPGKSVVVVRGTNISNSNLATGSEMYQWYVSKNYFMNELWPKTYSRTSTWQ